MKLPPPTPEQEEAINRSMSAARLIEGDPALKEYIRELFSGKANQLRREALVKLTVGISPDDALEAKVKARTASGMDECYQIHISMSQEPKTV